MAEQQELLVFSQTFEGLFSRAMGKELSEECCAKLKDIGVDLARPLMPAYPFSTWMKAVAIAAEYAHPDLPAPEARNLLGQKLVFGYRETMIGRAMLAFLKVVGPRRTLERAAHSFRTGNNYTETRVKQLSDRSMELWMNEVGPYPEFTQGIVLAGIKESGAQSPEVKIVDHDGHAATYHVTWA
jgi:uncharacterized protein (TIGR02265 family)